MPTVYIRETRSMKAAPVGEEEKFRKAHPKGKFVYFDADTGKRLPDPDKPGSDIKQAKPEKKDALSDDE